MTASDILGLRQPRLSSAPPERGAWLVCLPLLALVVCYSLPSEAREQPWIMFGPQLVGYAALMAWLVRNGIRPALLGLAPAAVLPGLRQGSLVGMALGAMNLGIILWVIPALGGDIDFLRDTPHARAPAWIMFPLGIAIIGVMVELHFRGFQLGRLAALLGPSALGRIAAVLVSALSFAWDPFMVHVFRSLHWIAFWDALVWGILFLRSRSLYATMAAHTVEVLILYASLKLWFG